MILYKTAHADRSIKSKIRHLKSSHIASVHSDLLVELASKKGASSWLTVLPWQEHIFALHKTGFHDVIALRYGWDPARVPLHCPCGAKFTIEQHSFSCDKGGFPL